MSELSSNPLSVAIQCMVLVDSLLRELKFSEDSTMRHNLANAIALVKQSTVEPAPVAPIVSIYVSDGKIVSGTFYAPSLPDGRHELFPVPVSAQGEWKRFQSSSEPPEVAADGAVAHMDYLFRDDTTMSDVLKTEWVAAKKELIANRHGLTAEQVSAARESLLDAVAERVRAVQPPRALRRETEIVQVHGKTLTVTHICDGQEVITGGEDGQVWVATFADPDEARAFVQRAKYSQFNFKGERAVLTKTDEQP